MPQSPAEPQQRRPDRFVVALRAALAAIVVTTFVVHAVYGPDWELLTTKHYWARTFFYGGYAEGVFSTRHGYRAIQKEGYANLTNIVPMTTSDAFGPSSPRVTGFPGTERLLAPFAASGIVRVTGVDLLTAFWILSVAAWLIAIVLVYRIAQLFYSDAYSPLLSAMVVAAYPVFTLTFNGMKLHQLGTTYLLVGVYFYERTIRHQLIWLQLPALASLLFIGMFAGGGWALLALYLLMRQLWIPGRQRWMNLAVIVVSTGAARYELAELTRSHELPSIEQYLQFNYSQVLSESWRWVTTWLADGDVSQLKFFNLQGDSAFRVFLPTITRAFLTGHLWSLVFAAIACWFVPAARMFLLMAVPMFLLGHLGTALTGWAAWHYGYLSAPAGILCFLAMCGGLGALANAPSHARKAAALLLTAAVLWGFLDQKRHAGLFYGGNPLTFSSRVSIHYEGHDRDVTY